MIRPGNINLHTRPVVRNPDGSVSTVRSITVGTGNGFVLLPTVVGGRVVSDWQAVQHFLRSGQHLGFFNSERAADLYANALHNQQDRLYRR